MFLLKYMTNILINRNFLINRQFLLENKDKFINIMNYFLNGLEKDKKNKEINNNMMNTSTLNHKDIILDEYHKFNYPQHNFNKTLILYVFHEYNDRVINFINNCIFKHNNYDFLIIINNINFDISILNLPEYVKYIIRDNIGFDFGGWSNGLLINNLYKNYDSFIFINSSVYGPCMEKYDTRLWTDILLNGLYYNNIRLFGSTINCENDRTQCHVQSMVFCMDLETLEYLITKEIFSLIKYCVTLVETIIDKEIRMSQEIINNNWNIGCLHNYYRDIDFTFKNQNREIKYLNDLNYYNKFYGKTIHPYEILFIKGNRNIYPNFIKNYIKINIIIYILCHNEKKLHDAMIIYGKYNWAKPILMKYQDYSFENAFWKQLNEIKNEWINYDMVGVISFSAYSKINLDNMNFIINNNKYYPRSYYNFFDTLMSIPNWSTHNLKYFDNIWYDILEKLNFFNVTQANCNYWMCKPKLMEKFIDWYHDICLPIMLKNKYIFEDSKYENTFGKEELIKLWGKPYYPHFPFIQERLNKYFFVKNYSIVFLISHERLRTSAVNAILNVESYYKQQNIKTILLYLDELDKINIVNFINKTSIKYNCNPIVICNTLVCHNIVEKLIKTTIPTFWYIHEWYEKNGYFDFITNKSYLFESNVKLIFTCESSYKNYKTNFPKLNENYIIIHNSLNKEILEIKKQQSLEKNIVKNENDIFISIIGTICERKNQQKFIDDIFYKINDKYKNVKLLLLGNILEKITIRSEYIKDMFIFNYINNPIPYINLSDIIISYSNNEVFPLNILESFFCKKPVISTNVGGINEIITDNKDGFLIEKNNHQQCYEKLSELIENQDLRTTIGLNAYDTFNDRFENNKVMKKFDILLSYINMID